MTSNDKIIVFNDIVPDNRKPKEFGDYNYIDISCNKLYDISHNIVYDISNNITFYKLNYYKKYLIDCVNYVSITEDKDNYIYLFLLDLYHNNIPICKIGYTSDILHRTIKLKSYTNKNMLLLAIMPTKGEFQEKELHKYLKNKCSYCIMDYKYPNGTNATELYKVHPILLNELYNYMKNLDKINNNNILILQEKTKQIEYVEKTKQEQEKTKQIECIEKTKQEQEKTKQLELQLKILKIKNKYLNETNTI